MRIAVAEAGRLDRARRRGDARYGTAGFLHIGKVVIHCRAGAEKKGAECKDRAAGQTVHVVFRYRESVSLTVTRSGGRRHQSDEQNGALM